MFFRRLNSGIYIDNTCNCVLQLPEGWYIPDNHSQKIRELMLEIEERCNVNFLLLEPKKPICLESKLWSGIKRDSGCLIRPHDKNIVLPE